MKRRISYHKYFFIAFLFIGLLLYNVENKAHAAVTKDFAKISYFKIDNMKRYQAFKKKYPHLRNEDIVTYVNIGLDYPFYQNTKAAMNLNKDTILVNKYHQLSSDYIPLQLVVVNSDYTTKEIMLQSNACKAFESMALNMQLEDLSIKGISGYRSFDYQEQLYNSYVAYDGIDKTDTYSARPGYSEHQTGLVIDVLDKGATNFNNFDKTLEHNWIKHNCYRYGFIIRYPAGKEKITGYNAEAWHLRYVGIKIATYIYLKDITFEEYYAKFLDK